jgi:limonene-1,2-epoxide hydrolase
MLFVLNLTSIRKIMTPQDLKDIATRWFKAFNEQNLDDLLSLYDGSAQHYSPKLKIREPETNGLIKGKDALRNWWKDSFERLPTLKYEGNKLTADSEQVFMEYTRKVEGEENMEIGEVLEIKEGKIVFSRVYHG